MVHTAAAARARFAHGRTTPRPDPRGTRVALLLACSLAAACSVNTYTGAARELTPQTFRKEAGWLAVDNVPLLRQHDEYDCGRTALAMVLSYWYPAVPAARFAATQSAERASAGELRDRARSHGLAAFVVEGTLNDIAFELKHKRPVIVGTAKPTFRGTVAHYEVVVGLHVQSRRIATLDPGLGLRQNSLNDFLHEWIPTGRVLLVVLPRGQPALAHAGSVRAPYLPFRK